QVAHRDDPVRAAGEGGRAGGALGGDRAGLVDRGDGAQQAAPEGAEPGAGDRLLTRARGQLAVAADQHRRQPGVGDDALAGDRQRQRAPDPLAGGVRAARVRRDLRAQCRLDRALERQRRRADGGAPSLALQRTVESALRAEVSPNPGGAHATGQWVRRALPLTISGQGVVADAGLPAVLIGSNGELSARAGEEPVSRARLGSFGRGLLRTVTAIDEAGPIAPERAARPPAFAGGPDGIITMRNL